MPDLDPSKRKKLINDLLGARRVGPPPFLIRNLKYVKDHRRELTSQIWDLHWAVDHSRGSASTIRKLSLTARPFRCILSDSLQRKYHKMASLPPNTNTLGKIRLWLSVETSVGENIAFSVRESNVRLWSKTQCMAGEDIEDLTNNYQVFDLSAVCAFIDSFPSKLSVVFELYTLKANTNSDSPLLRGEHVLFDNYINPDALPGTAVPNGDFILLLTPTTKEQNDENQPGMGLTKKPVEKAGASSAGNTIINNNYNTAINVDDDDDDENVDMIDTTNNVDKDESMIENLGPQQGIVTLNLTGSIGAQRPARSDDKKKYGNHVLVECQYHSPAYPWWNGITRHDFICPWCHRNCRRLRTLLFHFHLDHDRTELALEAIQKPQDGKNGSGNSSEPNFILHLSVTPVKGAENSIPMLPNGATGSATENLSFNKQKFPKYPENTPENGAPNTNVNDLDLSKLRMDDANGNGNGNTAMGDNHSVSTEEDPRDAIMRHNLGWATCQNTRCRRTHHHAYPANPNFCSEWCELLKQNSGLLSVGNGAREDDEDVPIKALAKPKRKIDFDKCLGDKTLYHVVSLTPFLKDHFVEDGADSEDEVDHSWRLRIVEDKLGCLETACAKNRVLWTMWNRYGFENYPAPGAYAERYTRYSVEKFVLEYGSEIHRLHLRQHLAAFLKILHVHGCIDSLAIISIFLCLDGKKRLKHCQVSSRPEKYPVPDPLQVKRRKGRRRIQS